MKLQMTLAAMLSWMALAASACAQQDHQHPEGTEPDIAIVETRQAGPHGGSLQQLDNMQVETVVAPGGLRLFAYDRQGQPLDVRNARGLVMLKIKGDTKRYRYDLFPEITKDRSAASLAVAVDLSRIGGRSVELAYQLVGLPGNGRVPNKFAENLRVPMTEAQQLATAIEAQRTCPASGQPLGKMDKPIAVTVGGETVYVCCAGCIEEVKANPTKYFAKKPQLTVTKATEADAAAIAEQKLCPVMDEPLGGMGPPLKVTGLGRDVFLCCKGCLKFLEQEPKKYLAKLPPLPGPTVAKATQVDTQFVAAQKLCPVMDEPLDAMGGPYKTVVDGRVVYLCCPGCAKKLHATPAVFLQKLANQGVTPPIVR
jgi:YHS domain-containing protein